MFSDLIFFAVLSRTFLFMVIRLTSYKYLIIKDI